MQVHKGLKKVGYLNVTIDLDKIEHAINIHARVKAKYQEIIRDLLNRVKQKSVYIPKLLAIPTRNTCFAVLHVDCPVSEFRPAFLVSISAANRNISNTSEYVRMNSTRRVTTYAEIAARTSSLSFFLTFSVISGQQLFSAAFVTSPELSRRNCPSLLNPFHGHYPKRSFEN